MQEQIDGRVIDVMRKLQREAQDDEYEASTPAAGRWRERIASSRHDHGPTAGEISDDEVLGADARTTRLAQRHRFGRALDLPPAEPSEAPKLRALVIMIAVVWAAIAALAWWLA